MIPKPNIKTAVILLSLATFTLASSAALAMTREEIIQINSKAVVKIIVLTSDAKGDYQFSGVGSGFFISHQGYIVTNYHVALEAVESDAALLAQYWYSPSKYILFTVRVVKSNRPHDLALLQVSGYWDAEAEKILEVPPDIEFPCVVMGSSSVVQLGSEVIVIGFPPLGSRGDASGMINTTMKVTRGIISGFNDEQNFYETDAVVHGGNSGGPALSEGGVVIGVTSAIYEQQQAIGLIRPACDLRVILSTKILSDIDAERAENSLGEWDCGEGESGETTSPIAKKTGDSYEDEDTDYGSSYDSGDSTAHVSGKVVVRGANRGIPEAIIVVMYPDNADVFVDKFNNGEEQEWKDYLDKYLVAFAQTDSGGAFVLSDELDANSEYKFVLIKGGYDMNMYKVVTAGSTDVGNLEMDPASDEPPVPASSWSYDEYQDKMGRGIIKTASVRSINEFQFDFPYQGAQRATLALGLRSHPEYAQVVVLSIERGQFLCGIADCYVTVRFDQGKAQEFIAAEPSDNSTTSLSITNYDSILAGLRKSKKVYIEAQFFQEGTQVFEFDVSGLKW